MPVERDPGRKRRAIGQRHSISQDVAIEIAERGGGDGEDEAAILGQRDVADPIENHRGVVDRGDRDEHLADGRQEAIGSRDFERHSAVEIGGRIAAEGPGLAVVAKPRGQRLPAEPADFDQQHVAIDVADQPGGQDRAEVLVLGALERRDRGNGGRIVDRFDRDPDPRGRGPPGAVFQLVIDPRLAVEIGVGGDLEQAEALVGDRHAMGGDEPADEDRVVIGVEVVRGQLAGEDAERRVLAPCQHVGHRDRRVGNIDHVDADRRRDRIALLVLDRVFEHQLAVEIVRRGHPVLAVVEQRRSRQAEESQRRTLGGVVVGHQHRRIDVDERVFKHVEAIIRDRDRQGESRVDEDRGEPDAGRAMAVGDAIVEPGVADVARLRGKYCGRARPDDAALIAVEHFDQAEAVALDIAIVDDQRGEIDRQHLVGLGDEHARRVVAGAEPVGVGDRRVVDRGDVEPDDPGS